MIANVSGGTQITVYVAIDAIDKTIGELQYLLATWGGACPHPPPDSETLTYQQIQTYLTRYH